MGDAGDPDLVTLPPPARSGLPSDHPTSSFWQTSHPNDLSHCRSTPELPTQADVVVIGTGISGTFAVQELLDNAKRLSSTSILALEARTLCSAATGRNGGHLQPVVHAAPPDILSFEMANFDHISNIIKKQGIECDFRRVEGCLGFWNQEYFDEAKEAIAASSRASSEYDGLVRVVETPAELQTLGLQGGAVGAIVQKVAASLSPYKLCVSLWRSMLQKDGPLNIGRGSLNLQTSTPVTALIRSDAGWTISTSRGEIVSPNVILATNAYTSHLAPQIAPLIRPVQAQMSALIPPSTTAELIPKSYGFEGVGEMDRVMSDYLVQNPYNHSHGGHLMFGGGRHLCLHHGEDNCDDSYVDKNVEKYLRTLPQRLNVSALTVDTGVERGQMLDISASWTGIIGHSADGHPWVGPVPKEPGLFICAGYTGHGMTNAPLCGRHVGRLVVDSIVGTALERQGKGTDGHDCSVPDRYVISQERMVAVCS